MIAYAVPLEAVVLTQSPTEVTRLKSRRASCRAAPTQFSQSSVAHVHAVGDVSSRSVGLAPYALHEAERFARNLCARPPAAPG